MNSISYDILDTCPGCLRNVIIVHSRQAGPEENAWADWRIIPKMWQDSSPETSSTVLLTINWVPRKRWNKLGWNGRCNPAAECMAEETQVPSKGSCKKSESLAITWKDGFWERSKKFHPVALPRCKRDKVQGVQGLQYFSSAFSNIAVGQTIHCYTCVPTLRCPQGVKLKPKDFPVRVWDSRVPRCGAPIHTKV